jgi:ketosteroid isomerase-like protein
MSENLDLVRSIYAAWEGGDYNTAPAWADPEIEFVVVDGPSPGTWTGLAALADAWRDFTRGVEDIGTSADGYRELDEERVLVPTRYSARGKGSGMTVETCGAILLHVRGGRVGRLVRYWACDRAFADLGLKE